MLVLSWLILAQGSPTSEQLGVKTNKSRRGQSILSSLTVLCVVINIHRRDMMSAGQWGVGGWGRGRGRAEDRVKPQSWWPTILPSAQRRFATTIALPVWFSKSLLSCCLFHPSSSCRWSPLTWCSQPPCKSPFRRQSTKGTVDYLTSLAAWKEWEPGSEKGAGVWG